MIGARCFSAAPGCPMIDALTWHLRPANDGLPVGWQTEAMLRMCSNRDRDGMMTDRRGRRTRVLRWDRWDRDIGSRSQWTDDKCCTSLMGLVGRSVVQAGGRAAVSCSWSGSPAATDRSHDGHCAPERFDYGLRQNGYPSFVFFPITVIERPVARRSQGRPRGSRIYLTADVARAAASVEAGLPRRITKCQAGTDEAYSSCSSSSSPSPSPSSSSLMVSSSSSSAESERRREEEEGEMEEGKEEEAGEEEGGRLPKAEESSSDESKSGFWYETFVMTRDQKLEKLRRDSASAGRVRTSFENAFAYTSWIDVHRVLVERKLKSIPPEQAIRLTGMGKLGGKLEADKLDKLGGKLEADKLGKLGGKLEVELGGELEDDKLGKLGKLEADKLDELGGKLEVEVGGKLEEDKLGQSGKLEADKLEADKLELESAVVGGTAVLLDVRESVDFAKLHASGAKNAPLFRLIEGNSLQANMRRLGYALITDFAGTERNPRFVDEALAAVDGDKERTVIVMCSRGGSLETVVERKGPKPKSFKDPMRAFGIQSRSLKACYELQQEGFKNVLHLKGGLSNWSYEGFPVEGTNT
ncbi:hypothetical protein CBR_g51265 [Chara braunii]|uniref:Rhodanese domain-containing protein n=1 Tax=Chara braunii TaxID=69332 RepID=A0A388M8G7_CHABU|nr:hypothetical protein CBR_g51265 [Chara braunii]|eukprot:GBG90759.1 hypothetical protein CBR_g51265 [Chara braunii]